MEASELETFTHYPLGPQTYFGLTLLLVTDSNETWWEYSNGLECFKTTKIFGYDKLGG